MRSHTLARVVAASAAAAGATLLGVSLGGMAHVDRELAAAAAPAPLTTTYDRVAYQERAERRAARVALRRALCEEQRERTLDPDVVDGGTPVAPAAGTTTRGVVWRHHARRGV